MTDVQIAQNLLKYGKNELTPPKTEPLWLKFLKTLVGGFQLLLWTGAILSFVAYGAQCFQSADPPQDNVKKKLKIPQYHVSTIIITALIHSKFIIHNHSFGWE